MRDAAGDSKVAWYDETLSGGAEPTLARCGELHDVAANYTTRQGTTRQGTTRAW